MKPVKGYNNAQASEGFERLPAGGYIIKITGVKDDDEKQYLKIIYDIAEGPEKGRYAKETAENDYRHSFIRSYKESALGMFKAFILAVDAANGTNFNERIEKGFPEGELVGKIVGVLFGYEEYNANDGSVKERLRLVRFLNTEQVRAGDFKVPELKKLTGSSRPTPSGIPEGFSPLNDPDLPF